MGKTILVTGKEGYLSHEIAQHFLNQGCHVAVSIPRRADTLSLVDQERRLMQFPWNRPSAASSKNFLLTIDREWGPVDQVWIVVSPEREALNLGDLSTTAIDEALDSTLKGPLYLIRELLQRHSQQPNLTFHFVFYDEDPSSLPPLAAVHYHGLKATVSALMHQTRRRSIVTWAYESLVPKPDEFLTYVLTSGLPQPEKWNLLGEKKTLSWFGKKDSQ